MPTKPSLLALIILATLPWASTCREYSCPPCGTTKVPYPLSTGAGCGDTNYSLYCVNDVLKFLSTDGIYYRVLSIDPKDYKLVIDVPVIASSACYSSDLLVGGLRLDESGPFNISNRNTVMLFNCSDSILLSPLNCSSTSPCRKFEQTKAGSACLNTLCCSYLKDSSMTSHRIRVRVGGCTAYTSVVNIDPSAPPSLWSYGIELQWLPLRRR